MGSEVVASLRVAEPADGAAESLAYTDDAYIVNLVGRIYLGDRPLPCPAETVAALRELPCRTVFLSGNPTKTGHEYAAKLTWMGLPLLTDEIVASLFVLIQWLRREVPGACLFLIGEAPLKRALLNAGFVISEQAGEIDIVVASFNRTFACRRFQVAFVIPASAWLTPPDADHYCPVPEGREPARPRWTTDTVPAACMYQRHVSRESGLSNWC